MLKIRLARAWRKNLSFFRIVLTEARRAPQHWYQKVLGFYNPLTKELKFDSEEAGVFLKNGAQLSPSLKKILERNNIVI